MSLKLQINNRFQDNLPADPVQENYVRQVIQSCYSYVNPTKPSNAKLIAWSKELAEEIGITEDIVNSKEFLKVFSGENIYPGSKPYAMCYAGHQFGQWAGQLGDGRAINLFDAKKKDGSYLTFQLKGSGKTPYSRTADGLAVLRSSIREFLCSEAMHYLGIPTTRALSMVLSGDDVLRDVMYDGNPAYEKGAIVCRTAESFLRFGNYEIFAARQDHENLKILVDYTIEHYFNHLSNTENKYLEFFKEVSARTMDMILDWQRVGFVHGVMNTDNMSILGLTIDYGPYGWLEPYEPNWTPNTTDRQGRRYRFGNQPAISLWNLVRLANAIYPLVGDSKGFEEILKDYQLNYKIRYREMMLSKLGIEKPKNEDAGMIQDLEDNLQLVETDMTIFFRLLSNIEGDTPLNEYQDFYEIIGEAFYAPDALTVKEKEKWMGWVKIYQNRLIEDKRDKVERKKQMHQVNPKYVLRNYMAQMAIEAAEKEDYSILYELQELIKKPYEEQLGKEKWFSKRPEWARNKVGSSMLSCSS